MICLPISEREASRVEMVESFGLVGQPRDPLHDEVAALARDLAGVHTALVSLVSRERNWFAGIANFSDPDQCRWTSFCTHVVADPDRPLWVEDAKLDFRFVDNLYVVGEPHLRFYAGVPILVNGYAVGSLCVFGSAPRPHDPVLLARLGGLAKIVGADLATRHQVQTLRHSLADSADALIDCDDSGSITGWSRGAERLFGFSEAEALGRKVSIICPPDRIDAHNEGFDHWHKSGNARLRRRIELTAQSKDGRPVDIELWMSVTHINGVRHIHSNIRDISTRKRQAADLLAAKLESEAANMAKSTFLANMSHELRTPLNGIVAVAELMSKTGLTPHQGELNSIIQSSSDQLRRLIGDILDLARIESGEIEFADTPMSLHAVVSDVENLSTVMAQAKGLSLVTDVALNVAGPVMGDPLRLKQVLTNLVSNAVKFTETGSVTLRLTQTSSGFRFEVVDTGIGFTDDQRAKIFERFQQADGSITRRFGGTGLGLAISRELVAAMGGELECHGQPGKGAVFWFSLPLRAAAQSTLTSEPAEESGLGMGRALVVDDNATNRRVAELLLNSIGADVVSVEDGEQAVAAFGNGRFDVILMDMMMPVLDGIAATQAIRRIEAAEHFVRTPILMLTANSLPDHVAASLEAGADAHLAKPISAAKLFETLSSLCEGRDQTSALEPTSLVANT